MEHSRVVIGKCQQSFMVPSELLERSYVCQYYRTFY